MNPPVAAGDVYEWGRRVAKACVGSSKGDGGFLRVRRGGLIGEWVFSFKVRRVRWPVGLGNGIALVDDGDGGLGVVK